MKTSRKLIKKISTLFVFYSNNSIDRVTSAFNRLSFQLAGKTGNAIPFLTAEFCLWHKLETIHSIPINVIVSVKMKTKL